MGSKKRTQLVTDVLTASLARLGRVYIVEIEHTPTGGEWTRVGEDLAEAMEEAAQGLPSPPPPTDELVEA